MTIAANIAANIKRLRLALGLTKNACAVLVGVNWQRWDWWERGIQTPGVKKLEDIARVLRCEPADLLKSEDGA